MKRRQANQAIENHDLSSRQFPMPGTDLIRTNAIPFNQAEDVDDSGGAFCSNPSTCNCGHHGIHYPWSQHGGHLGTFSYTEERPRESIYAGENPTRARK